MVCLISGGSRINVCELGKPQQWNSIVISPISKIILFTIAVTCNGICIVKT